MEEKEIFDEERKKKILEMEVFLKKSKDEALKFLENLKTKEDFLSYWQQCTPWKEYKKEWMKFPLFF